MLRRRSLTIALIACGLLAPFPANAQMPGTRTVLDAHNCYPYDGRWADRIDRALSTGLPVAIEQDLNLYVPPNGGTPRVVVAHGGKLAGSEPTLEAYFFARVRPIMEAALRNPDHSQWPLITLNLDFKSEDPNLLHAAWLILQKHQEWLTTAEKTADDKPQPLKIGPMLVLTGAFDQQQKVFYDEVPMGGRLLLFGAVHTFEQNPMAPPNVLEPEKATNYRRWWNNPWNVVERGGQPKAGAWTAQDRQRLNSLVKHAHAHDLWIRFYTLDGATKAEQDRNGWFANYNFVPPQAVHARWKAAIAAGVDYIATDQYEALGKLIRGSIQKPVHR